MPEPTPAENHPENLADKPADSLAATPGSVRPMMRLDDVLKRGGLVGTGGQAKVWIQDGQVRVNGEIETRRRKQVFLGDRVEVLGQTFTLDETFFESSPKTE